MIGRRQFLFGAAAAGLFARIARTEPRKAPLRLLIVHKPVGTSPEHYDCTGIDALSPILEPFADLRDRMVIVDGLENRKQANTPGEDHANGITTFMTGGIPFRPSGSNVLLTERASIDQILARDPRFTGDTPIKSLQLSADDRGHQFLLRVISHAGYGKPVPPEESPLAAFARVFGTHASEPELRAHKQSVLDFTRADLVRVQQRMGSAERARLDQHLTSIREAEEVMHRIAPFDPLPLYQSMQAAHERQLTQRDLAHGDVGRAHFELVRVAFQWDLTRIACFTWDSFQQNVTALVPELPSQGYHDLSHSGPLDAEAKVHRWYNEQLALLLRGLRDTPDVDGRSLLDNTLVVSWTEMRLGYHTFDNTPIQLFGGAGDRLAGGRLVRYPGYSTNDMWRTVFNALGDPREVFGDENKNSGRLAGLFRELPLDDSATDGAISSRSRSLAP